MVQALPQYTDQIDKLSLHVEVGCYVVCDMVQSFKIGTCPVAFLFYTQNYTCGRINSRYSNVSGILWTYLKMV